MSDTPKSAAQRVEEAVGFKVISENVGGYGEYKSLVFAAGGRVGADAFHQKLQDHCISECERADRAEAELARLRSILIDSIKALGGVATPEVSNDFLANVPESLYWWLYD